MPDRRYRAYGLVFSSGLLFPDLETAQTPRASIRLTLRSAAQFDEAGWRDGVTRCDAAGTPWLVVSRRGGEYRLQVDGTDFVLRADRRTVDVYRRPLTRIGALRHLALNQVLPMILGHRGQTVLHASAFATEHGAVVLLGPTGSGKSTLVASFAAHGQPVMSDDAVVLQRRRREILTIPAYGDVRVNPDTYAMLRGVKKPVPSSGDPLPLAAMYVLAPAGADADVRIDRLSKREALIELLTYSFVLDVTDRARLAAQLDRLTRCLPQDVRRIAVPRDFSALDRVRRAIVADL